MSKFRIFTLWIVIAEILLILLTNRLYFHQNNDSGGRLYLVEARRVIKEIEEQKLGASEIEAMSLNKYETIVGIKEFAPGEVCDNDYLVEEIAGKLYRIEYVEERSSRLPLYINISLLGMMIVTIMVLVYVYQKVLKPFQDMSNLSYELAKGNLSMPVKEEKSKMFGHFLWGMNMLREKLEDNKEKELAFQKERKTLILSLSHDIKTPLSSIELYSKALSENLYDTQERKDKALQGIIRNVKEIKGYVDEIVTASREDFMNLEKDIVREIKRRYPEHAVTLSIGERERESYERFFAAGADRYLLRHETANDTHYRKLHPESMSLSHRKQCLRDLKEIGYQTGCGFMVGSPGQTAADLAEDFLFIHELHPEMIGIGPFIPHQDPPFANETQGTLEQTLYLLSLLRIMQPDVLLPATTALATIHPRGRELGILAGANVLMPNLSPVAVRAKYSLYDGKVCTGDEAAECRNCLERRVESVGYHTVVARGDNISILR